MNLVACSADLPRRYLLKLVAVDISHEVAEKPLMYDNSLLNALSTDDVKRLTSAYATFRLVVDCVLSLMCLNILICLQNALIL